jgi:hypothetical protein
MTYKVYSIGALAIIALIVAIVYNPVQDNFDLDATNEQWLKQSAQWEWIKGQVDNTKANGISNTDSIKALEDRINNISTNVSNLNNKVIQLEGDPITTEPIVEDNEIVDFFTTDNDSDREDRFDQGDIIYFYVVVDTDERYLYYEIINDDTNDVIKDKRLTISENVDNLVWAWSIPSDQTAGDYHIEIEVGQDKSKLNFDVRTS